MRETCGVANKEIVTLVARYRPGLAAIARTGLSIDFHAGG